MSVKAKIKRTPKFTCMEEMKRWQGEREDRLHREHVRKKMQQVCRERQRQPLPKTPK